MAFFCCRIRCCILLRYNYLFPASCHVRKVAFCLQCIQLHCYFLILKTNLKISGDTQSWVVFFYPNSRSFCVNHTKWEGQASPEKHSWVNELHCSTLSFPFKSGLLLGSCIHIYLDVSSNHKPLGFSVNAQAQKTLKLVRKMNKI